MKHLDKVIRLLGTMEDVACVITTSDEVIEFLNQVEDAITVLTIESGKRWKQEQADEGN